MSGPRWTHWAAAPSVGAPPPRRHRVHRPVEVRRRARPTARTTSVRVLTRRPKQAAGGCICQNLQTIQRVSRPTSARHASTFSPLCSCFRQQLRVARPENSVARSPARESEGQTRWQRCDLTGGGERSRFCGSAVGLACDKGREYASGRAAFGSPAGGQVPASTFKATRREGGAGRDGGGVTQTDVDAIVRVLLIIRERTEKPHVRCSTYDSVVRRRSSGFGESMPACCGPRGIEVGRCHNAPTRGKLRRAKRRLRMIKLES